jgi:site-specific recombinase XerD
MQPNDNPMKDYPKTKSGKRKLQDVLTRKEIHRLLKATRTTTVLGLRDRALLTILLETGIRASECAGLRDRDVRLAEGLLRVVGKGGDERTVPLPKKTIRVLSLYRKVRGTSSPDSKFFKSRKGGGLSRYGIYERVRRYARRAGIRKKVTPHILRHTFATHMYRDHNVKLIHLKELLGHRLISSTQIYVHMTMNDLRKAINKLSWGGISDKLEKYLPNMKLPYQNEPGKRYAFQKP